MAYRLVVRPCADFYLVVIERCVLLATRHMAVVQCSGYADNLRYDRLS